jgi:hypothetical protein
VNAHGTGTVFNDAMEARAFTRFFGTVPPVWGVKGALGHTLGAAGAFEALVSVLALREGRIPPTAGLDEPDPASGLDVVRGGHERSRPVSRSRPPRRSRHERGPRVARAPEASRDPSRSAGSATRAARRPRPAAST